MWESCSCPLEARDLDKAGICGSRVGGAGLNSNCFVQTVNELSIEMKVTVNE